MPIGERGQEFAVGRWQGATFDELELVLNDHLYGSRPIDDVQIERTFDGYFYLTFPRNDLSGRIAITGDDRRGMLHSLGVIVAIGL